MKVDRVILTTKKIQPVVIPAFFMIKYTEIKFEGISEINKEILIATLPEFGFIGMEETEEGLVSYGDQQLVNMEELRAFTNDNGLVFQEKTIEEENWNALWESNFDPVIIPGKIHVRAHFHPELEGIEHEILITPKMSFGTGHHATTRMMMKCMLDMDFKGKKVIDFGTGTGILAILAEKLDALSIEAIDNDQWSITNVEENILSNQCNKIIISLGVNLDLLGKGDIVLANINKSVLIDHAMSIDAHLTSPGILVLSGLLQADYEDILKVYEPILGSPLHSLEDSGWIALVFEKGSN